MTVVLQKLFLYKRIGSLSFCNARKRTFAEIVCKYIIIVSVRLSYGGRNLNVPVTVTVNGGNNGDGTVEVKLTLQPATMHTQTVAIMPKTAIIRIFIFFVICYLCFLLRTVPATKIISPTAVSVNNAVPPSVSDITGLQIVVIYDDYSSENADMSKVTVIDDQPLTEYDNAVRLSYGGRNLNGRIIVVNYHNLKPCNIELFTDFIFGFIRTCKGQSRNFNVDAEQSFNRTQSRFYCVEFFNKRAVNEVHLIFVVCKSVVILVRGFDPVTVTVNGGNNGDGTVEGGCAGGCGSVDTLGGTDLSGIIFNFFQSFIVFIPTRNFLCGISATDKLYKSYEFKGVTAPVLETEHSAIVDDLVDVAGLTSVKGYY